MIKYLSICSGIESASVAWEPLGWKALGFSEIEPFPCSLLAYHYPSIPNFGDMNGYASWDQDILSQADVLVGGPPCQAFSVAGLRNGLEDDRGSLTLTYVKLFDYIDELRRYNGKLPAICLYENVPGLLSSKDNAFGAFLGALSGEECELVPSGKRWSDSGCVYGPERTIAWRILDAQYFGLAQRRRRLFVIASARDDFDPSEVLFEFDSMRRDTPPSRKKGKETTGCFEPRSPDGCARVVTGGIAPTLNTAQGGQRQPCVYAADGYNASVDTEVFHTLSTEADAQHVPLVFREGSFGQYVEGEFGTIRASGGALGGGSETFALAGSMIGRQEHNGPNGSGVYDDCSPTLTAGDRHAVAFKIRSGCEGGGKGYLGSEDLTFTLDTVQSQNLFVDSQVRRLTPLECERLQGFPDGYTRIPVKAYPHRTITKLNSEDLWEQIDGAWYLMTKDTPRYKALGNSKPVDVVRWIGIRLEKIISRGII